MVNPLTYNELLRLMHFVDKQSQIFRNQADFSAAHAPADLDYWNAEIAKNNLLYRHLKDLATEQLQAARSASSPVRV